VFEMQLSELLEVAQQSLDVWQIRPQIEHSQRFHAFSHPPAYLSGMQPIMFRAVVARRHDVSTTCAESLDLR
jgi:hypothetical protein